MKLSLSCRVGLAAFGLAAIAANSVTGTPYTVAETGTGASKVVTISSSTIGNNLNVYAGILDLSVNGTTTFAFCIDPWHWSDGNAVSYASVSLSADTKAPLPMSAETALQIGQLWDEYYSATITSSVAAGLQLAIWELVGNSVSASTNGASWFKLDSSNDYGAGTFISWVDSHPTAASANLVALSGAGQDYAVASASLPPVITSATSVSAKLNEPFTYTITASGNPTSYGATGLPSGLSVNAGAGLISGTPSAVGTYQVTVSATNPVAKGSATLTITVAQTYTLAMTGSPASGGIFSGAGTYDPGTTVSISETPASSYRAGGWGGTDGAKTASPSSAATTIVMNANRTLVAEFVQQATLTVTAGTGGTATGGGVYDAGSTVPISATPTGNYVFTGWTGTGITNSKGASTTVTVPANEIVTASFAQPPTFVGSNSGQTLVTGQSYSLQINTTPAATFSASQLPPGLSINPNTGLISGTPTSAGGWTGTITATDSAGSASETVSFTVYAQPVITSALTSNGKLDEPISYTVTASGNPTSFGASGLPPGLSINPTSGIISGSPTTSGTYPVTVSATNPGATGTATLTLNVAQTYTLQIAGSPAAGGAYSGAGTYDPGTVVTVSETANGGYRAAGWGGPDGGSTASPSSASTTIVMSANRSLVANFVQQATLTVTAGTGGTAIGGGLYDIGATVPIAATPNANYAFTSWSGTGVTNASAATTTVTVAGNEIVTASFAQPPAFTDGDVGQVLVAGQPSSVQETATNSPTFSATGLPPGLSINPNSGLISGTPDAPGYSAATITATNAGGSATETLNFTVYPQPVITSDLSSDGKLDEPFGYTITASGSPTSFGATGLPPGLSIDPSSGIISGTPTAAGTFAVTVSATNPGTTGTATLDLSVAQTYRLTITGSPAAGGSFSGAGVYDPGTVVSIGETANPDYRTAGWTGPDAGSTAAPSNALTTIVMSADRTLVADFVQQGTLTVTAGIGGTATGGGTYDVGSSVAIVATPAATDAFSSWTGSPVADSSAATTTITITGDLSVNANFVYVPQPPTATLNAAATAYTGSPFTVTSSALAPDDNLTLHSIEWMSPSGTWTVDSATASGGSDNRSLGINFPTTGTYTLRAGASVDNGTTWVYSPTTQVVVSNGIVAYTLQTMAVPTASLLEWYTPSPVAQKIYQVQHKNP